MSGPTVRDRLRRGPDVGRAAFVAESAVLTGEVRLLPGSSVWYGVAGRGDLEPIEIGEESNVQDLAVLHVDVGFPVRVGARVSVGHRAILHGCVVEDECLIGMGAVLLSGSRVGRGSLVAAGAVVREGQEIPPGSLVAGVPARIIRAVDEATTARIRENARSYVTLAAEYRSWREEHGARGPHGGPV